MPRRRSGRSSMGTKPSKKPASKSTTPAPAPAPAKASAPAMSGPSTGGLGSMIVDGLVWGGANAVAHRVADAILGPRVVQVETVAAPSAAVAATQAAPSMAATPDACVGQYKAFNDCLNTSGNDISRCQFYMDMLTECRKSGPAAGSTSAKF